jgi:hypothetical protein
MPHFDLAGSYPTAESKSSKLRATDPARKAVLLTGSNSGSQNGSDLIVACPTPFLTTSSLLNHFSCEGIC